MDQERARPEPERSGSAPESDGTFSAGEVGAAGDRTAQGGSEVVIGEIPAADDPTTMLWTARCSEPSHDLLGHFPSRDEAEKARADHLEAEHGGAR